MGPEQWDHTIAYVVYGPLSLAQTTLSTRELQIPPAFDRCGRLIEKWSVTVFFLHRAHGHRRAIRQGDKWPDGATISPVLRLLGSVGEHINRLRGSGYHA